MVSKIFPSIKQPIAKGQNGFFTPCYGKETIRNSIMNILLTRIGERVHLPEFGSRLWELVFEQADEVLEVMAGEYVFDAIRRWEPRVDVLSAVVTYPFDHEVALTIQYRIKQSASQESTLVLKINRDVGSIAAI